MGSREELLHVLMPPGAAQPLTGVIHAGGVLRDATLHQQTAQHVRDVFAPKAANLQTLQQVRSVA